MGSILKEKPYLIWGLGLLLFLRFVFVPVIEWQETKKNSLTLLQGKFQKAIQLLKNEQQLETNLAELRRINAKYEKLLPVFSNETQFQLTKQAWLEGIAAVQQLSFTRMGWNKVFATDGQLPSYQLELSFKGRTKQVMNFLLALEQSGELLQIEGYSFGIKRHRVNSLGLAQGKIKLLFYSEFDDA